MRSSPPPPPDASHEDLVGELFGLSPTARAPCDLAALHPSRARSSVRTSRSRADLSHIKVNGFHESTSRRSDKHTNDARTHPTVCGLFTLSLSHYTAQPLP